MALEDIAVLSKILRESKSPLPTKFEIYEELRRPRVANMFSIADRNGDVRKKTSPWKVRLIELGVTAV